jgi:hypothetical protein
MADPTIKIKRSAVEGKIPTADQVPLGEIALNTYDGKLFASKNVGIGTTVFVVNPWSVGTGTNTYNTYFTSGSVGIGTINPQSALDVRGTISIGRTDAAGINSIRSVIDINSWEHAGVFKATGTDDGTPQDIFFKDDGTEMFILGDSGNEVNEYSLSTAWDVSTAGFTTVFSTSLQETNPTGLYFKPDGTRMYICGGTGVAPTGDRVYSYTLNNPWSLVGVTTDTVAGAGTTVKNFNVGAQDTAPQAVYFKDDGLKMYVVGSTNDAVYEYSLSTAWELDSTITLLNTVLVGAGNTLNLPLSLTAPTGIDFNASGTKMYITDNIRDVVARFDLSTPWDTTTISFFDNVYVGFQELTPNGIFYQEDQSKAYIVGSSNDTVYQFNTDVPSLELSSSGITTRSSIILNNEARLNNRLYVTNDAHFSSNANIKGTLTADGTINAVTLNITGAIDLADSDILRFGSSDDWEFFHNGTHNYMDLNVGNLIIRDNTTTRFTFERTTGNLLLGSSSSTGTASQPLQVTGGGYVSGRLGVGNTNPSYDIDVTGSVGITTTSGDALILTSTNSSARTSIVLNTNGNDWEISARSSAASAPANSFYIYDKTAGAYRQVIDPSGNVLLGGATAATGTASQPLQVGSASSVQGAYISGNLGIANTNPTSKLSVVGDGNFTGVVTATTFVGQINAGVSTISVNSSIDALRITQTGAGNALVVEDSDNPDATPFVIRGDGNVGIGTTNPSEELHIVSSQPLIRFTETDGATDNRNWNVGVNAQEFYWQALTDAGSGGGNLFKMTRSAAEIQTFEGRNAANTWFIVNNNTQRVGIGTSIASAVLDVRGNPWFSPNTTGVKATALRLGRFVDGVNAAFDILTDDNTGDDIEIQSNRYTGKIRFSRSSPSGIQTTFILDSNYLTGTSISIADTTGTSTKIKLDEAGNTFFNNSGAVLVGTISSTGTASQRLQVTGGAYVSDSVGIGVTNPQDELHLAASSNVGIRLQDNAPGGGSYATINYNDNGSGTNALTLSADEGNTGTNTEIRFNIDGSEVSRYAVGGELLVGASSTTGTASQRLQVDGGAYVSGNLGIGATNPGAKLDVTGDIRLSAADPEIEFNTGGPRLKVPAANTLTIHTGGGLNSTTSEVIRVNTTGVGIGTTNPTFKTHILDTGVTGAGLLVQGGGGGAFISKFERVVGGAGTVSINANSSNPQFRLESAAHTISAGLNNAFGGFEIADNTVLGTNTRFFVARGTGNTGIGTTNPTSKLHIDGDALVTGVVTATSFVKSGGTSSEFLKADGSVDSSTYLTTTGSGTNLTGIVTSIVAGSNITISGSTGQVTINSTATGGGGGAATPLDILEVMLFA